MEKLATLTQTDINNGVLNRMLANAGIPNVQEYIKNFHQETEELIIEEFEHPDPNKAEYDEQIVPPADIHSWITGLGPRLNDPIQPPSTEAHQKQQQQQQQLPQGVPSWITGLRPRFDDPIQPPLPEQQQQPTDLKSWMLRMAPDNLQAPTDNTITSQSTNSSTDNPAITGNLGTWLNDWSKNITELPPPASLDNWLQGLIPKNMNEPIGKANSPKGRLNTYLNAAQEVLSKHGYDVSNEIVPSKDVKTKTGMFGNVKQMYFLVSFIFIQFVYI
jgi:hypothetical protein